MEPECGMTPPYLASLGIYRAWMRERLSGLSDQDAWRRIVAAMPRGERRGMARTSVAGAHGQLPLTLSVPISGGGSVLKRGRPEEWRISMHGRWPAVHLGALEAAYSSTPYYMHLRDGIYGVLQGVKEDDTFSSLSTALHKQLVQLLGIDEIISDLRQEMELNGERLRLLSDEKSAGLHTDLTFLDVICRRGREAIFALL